MLVGTWVYKYSFESLLSSLLSRYSEVELLDYIIILSLIFWELTIPLFTVDASFCISTSPFYSGWTSGLFPVLAVIQVIPNQFLLVYMSVGSLICTHFHQVYARNEIAGPEYMHIFISNRACQSFSKNQ